MKTKIKIGIGFFILSGLFLMLANSCRKPKKDIPVIETGSVTDIEGTTYKTVKIGSQWWMAENLKVKKYRNGDFLPLISTTSSVKWDTLSTGAYCIYDDDPKAPGFLYNWYAVSDIRSIAPPGWHIPSDAEWKTMEEYLGMSQTDADKVNWRGTNQGDKLKIASPDGWTTYSSIWSTNESGFTALAGGCRMFNSATTGSAWSSPLDLNSTGFWWASDSHPDNKAWYRYLDYKSSNVFRYYGSKAYGFSIRCVKD